MTSVKEEHKLSDISIEWESIYNQGWGQSGKPSGRKRHLHRALKNRRGWDLIGSQGGIQGIPLYERLTPKSVIEHLLRLCQAWSGHVPPVNDLQIYLIVQPKWGAGGVCVCSWRLVGRVQGCCLIACYGQEGPVRPRIIQYRAVMEAGPRSPHQSEGKCFDWQPQPPPCRAHSEASHTPRNLTIYPGRCPRMNQCA